LRIAIISDALLSVFDEDLYIDLGCRMSGVLRSVTFRL
jgi:hypothetical protein